MRPAVGAVEVLGSGEHERGVLLIEPMILGKSETVQCLAFACASRMMRGGEVECLLRL